MYNQKGLPRGGEQKQVVYLCNDDDREHVLDLSVRWSSDDETRRHEFTLAANRERAFALDGQPAGSTRLSVQAESAEGVAVVDVDPTKRPPPVVVIRQGSVRVVPVSA